MPAEHTLWDSSTRTTVRDRQTYVRHPSLRPATLAIINALQAHADAGRAHAATITYGVLTEFDAPWSPGQAWRAEKASTFAFGGANPGVRNLTRTSRRPSDP